MSKIDWSKAPEGAEFYLYGNFYKLGVGGGLVYKIAHSPIDSWARLAGSEDYEKRPGQQAAKPIESVAAQYLKRCIDVQIERGKQYDSEGKGERSFQAAADAFNALTGEKLSGSDVCLLMVCLKVVRQNSNKSRIHDDSLLDGVSYLSLWAEELNKELKDESNN